MTRREWLSLAAHLVIALAAMFAIWGSLLALVYLFDALTS